MPRHMCCLKAPKTLLSVAVPVVHGRLRELLEETQKVGLDGGGGALNPHPELRAVGARCVVTKLSNTKDEIMETAMLKSKVPGVQTVPELRDGLSR